MHTTSAALGARGRLRSPRLHLVVLSAGHLVNDIYIAFLSPLLPMVVARFGMSLALGGLLSAILPVTTSFAQLLVGHLADTSGKRVFVVLGPGIIAAAMSMIGLAPGPAVLAVLLVIGGVGSAMFHPQGAAMVGATNPARKGFALSVFTTAGELGYALGPILVVGVVNALGLSYMPVMMVAGLLATAFIYAFGPPGRERGEAAGSAAGPGENHVPVGMLVTLWAIASLRNCVSNGFMTFLPVYFKELGLPLVVYGSSGSVLMLASTFGVMMAGPLADRIGAPRLLVGSLIVPVPLFLAFLGTRGLVSYAFLAAAGAVLAAPITVITMTAQNLAPRRAGTASALMMGVAWGTGSLGLIGAGAIADALGVRMALSLLLVTLVVAAALGCRFGLALRRYGPGSRPAQDLHPT